MSERLCNNNFFGKNVVIGENVKFGFNVIIEDNVVINSNSYIDSNTIIRSNVVIGENTFIGSNCIIGEYLNDFCLDRIQHVHELIIGENSLIRSGTILYAGSNIGNNFQTGHRVTIRENTIIGNNVSVGTLSDIQGNCKIGNYVRMHSNVHIGQLSIVDDFVWIYPYVVLTNDPTPPSNNFKGVHIHSFAIVATGSIVLPGIDINEDSLIAAGAIVTKNVDEYSVVGGNPAKVIGDVRKIKSKFTNEYVYPWRYHFDNYMPWKDSDYDTWYKNLNIEELSQYTID